MSFSTNAAIWDALAHTDPLWAVLTDPSRKGGRWTIEEFMATGESQVATVLERATQCVKVDFSGIALDFGCGPGRLTHALARRVAHCVGCDVSPRMIELASQMAPANCRFAVNSEPPLSMFPDKHFSLIYSDIVLQHIPEPCSLEYIRDFVRLLAPGGVAIFQVQLGIAGLPLLQKARHRLPIRLGLRPRQTQMGVYYLSRHAVIAAVRPASIVDEVFTGASSPDYNGAIRYQEEPPRKVYLSTQFTILKD
jgi:SAM-dependent methyltransferase